MQGCPYDALYIDPATETAAKCNFCAHKVEVGLEPPCVTVCPTQAIVAGDLDDPSSRIAQMTGRIPLQVRKPEKGTRPEGVLRRGGRGGAGARGRAAGLRLHVGAGAAAARPLPAMPAPDAAGAPRRTYGVREQHRNSWGWKVSAYLWTKSLAAGAFLVPAVARLRPCPGASRVPPGALLDGARSPWPPRARCSSPTCGSPRASCGR